MTVQCCVCKQIRVGKRWCEPRGALLPDEPVSHGYCPTCAAQAFAQLRREEQAAGSCRLASVAQSALS